MKLIIYDLCTLLLIITTCEGNSFGCDDNYPFAHKHECIAVMPTRSNHSQARKSCLKINGDLLVIRTKKMQTYVKHILLPYAVSTWHIGGVRNPENPGAFNDWEGNKLQYDNFGTEGTSNSKSYCIALITGSVYDGTWYDYPCDEPAMSICAMPRNYTSHPPFGCGIQYHDSFEGICIAHMTAKLRKEQAESVCVKMRGHLLTIRSKKMRKSINQIIAHNPDEPTVWFIDGYKSRENSHEYLAWNDEKIQYPNWTRKEYSTKKCLVLSTNHESHGSRIRQWDCFLPSMFLCGRRHGKFGGNNGKKSPPPITTKSGGHMGCNENYPFAHMHECIAVMPTRFNHSQARKSCLKIKGDLLIIRTEKMQAYVKHILVPYAVNTWHIGGVRNLKNRTDFVDWNGASLKYKNFGAEGTNSNSNCIALISGSVYDGTWYDYPCDEPAMSICAKPRDYTLSHTFLGCGKQHLYHKMYKGICIAPMTVKLRKEQAESVCVKTHGHLLTIRSKDMRIFMNTIIPHNTEEPTVWFIDGYKRSYKSHEYLAWNGQKIQYPNWTSTAYSSTRCMVLYDGSQISQWNCFLPNMFLCAYHDNLGLDKSKNTPPPIARTHSSSSSVGKNTPPPIEVRTHSSSSVGKNTPPPNEVRTHSSSSDLSHEEHNSTMIIVYVLIAFIFFLVILVIGLLVWKRKPPTRTGDDDGMALVDRVTGEQ